MSAIRKPTEMGDIEEERFKQKFPGKKPAQTDFLRKRFQKGVKYFDSGDYNMAKSANAKKLPLNPLIVGKAIPTPEVVSQRKNSVASKSNLVTATSAEEQEEEKQHFEETAPKQVKEEEEERQE